LRLAPPLHVSMPSPCRHRLLLCDVAALLRLAPPLHARACVADDELMEFLCQLRVEIDHAIDRCMTAEPEYLVMGMSAETFYGGWAGNLEFRNNIETRTNLRVATGAEACKYALGKFGAKRIACVTPYMPAMDKQVKAFFEEIGFECLRIFGFKCVGAVEIAHVTEGMAEAALREVDGDDIDAIVQCGTNLSFVAVADRMESVLGKPIIPINAATLWFALRENGIETKMYGCSRLCREF
jgi:maleate isomerase